MLNTSPIFLNCFSRGGSNILWNIFLSHPDVCSPINETLEIFRLDGKGVTVAGVKAAWLTRQLRFFNQWWLGDRSAISAAAARFIDETLFHWKMKTVEDEEMGLKREGSRYSRVEVEKARLVAKNNNGLVFLGDTLLEMYPDATFIALVRDPVALYESHRRRGITQSPSHFARFYSRIAKRMLEDCVRLPRYHIVRFEDLLADPLGIMQHLYRWAGLDADKVTKLRFKAKPHLQANGSHKTAYVAGRHYWFGFDEVYEILEPGINHYQVGQLEEAERNEVVALTEPLRHELGYA